MAPERHPQQSESDSGQSAGRPGQVDPSTPRQHIMQRNLASAWNKLEFANLSKAMQEWGEEKKKNSGSTGEAIATEEIMCLNLLSCVCNKALEGDDASAHRSSKPEHLPRRKKTRVASNSPPPPCSFQTPREPKCSTPCAFPNGGSSNDDADWTDQQQMIGTDTEMGKAAETDEGCRSKWPVKAPHVGDSGSIDHCKMSNGKVAHKAADDVVHETSTSGESSSQAAEELVRRSGEFRDERSGAGEFSSDWGEGAPFHGYGVTGSPREERPWQDAQGLGDLMRAR